MSHSSPLSDSNPQQERPETSKDRDRSPTDGESDTTLTGTAKELLDVLVATDVLLEAIDLDKLPEIVDVGELRTVVDLDRLSDAIRERDPDLAFDLSHLERVVDRRELWNALDVLEFANAKRTLDRELEDVVDAGASIEVGTDSKAVADARAFVSSLRDEAKDALVQQEVRDRMEPLRGAVVEAHADAERIYASNRARFGTADERSVAGNATAVSLLPSGPLPNGVSTRLSTVREEVPYSVTDALPRIYGRRWRRIKSARTGNQ